MGWVKEEIELCGTKKCDKVITLFDTGSNASFIEKDLAEELGYEKTGRYEAVKSYGKTHKNEEIKFKNLELKNYSQKNPKFYIRDISKFKTKIIMGHDVMQGAGIKIDMSKDKIIPKEVISGTFIAGKND